jgi:hypothetical protein
MPGFVLDASEFLPAAGGLGQPGEFIAERRIAASQSRAALFSPLTNKTKAHFYSSFIPQQAVTFLMFFLISLA